MMLKRIFKHFHFCCGLGGGAKGFNKAKPVMGTTLLLAEAGETFMLSSMPIWVQPVAVALSVSQQVTP